MERSSAGPVSGSIDKHDGRREVPRKIAAAAAAAPPGQAPSNHATSSQPLDAAVPGPSRLGDTTSSWHPSASSPGQAKGGSTVRTWSRHYKQQQQQHHQQQHVSEEEAALLQSLDDADDAADWLNGALQARRLQGSQPAAAARSLLQVNGIEDAEATSDVGNGGPPSEAAASRSRKKQLLTLDSHLASLSTTLTLAQQDTLTSMHATIADTSTTVPRLGRELRLMSDAARVLKEKIEHLRVEAQQAGLHKITDPATSGRVFPNGGTKVAADNHLQSSSDAVAVLERLSELSTLHSRMTAARDVLSLAESWSTLSSDVSAYLVDAKYNAAASRLAQAKQSLSVFERTPEYEGRKRLLDELCKSLEDRLTPSIADAIRDRDVARSKGAADVLGKVERPHTFAAIWRDSRRETCTARWSKEACREEQSGSESTSPTVVECLSLMLSNLNAIIEDERDYAQAVFANPLSEVETLVASVFTSMQPPLQDRLAAIVPYHQHDAVLHLVEAHNALRSACVSIEGTMSTSFRQLTQEMESLHVPRGSPTEGKNLSLSPENALRAYPFPGFSSPTHMRPSQHSRKTGSRRSSSISTTLPPAGSASLMADSNDRLANSPSPMEGSSPAATERAISRWSSLLNLIPNPRTWENAMFAPLVELQLNYEALERAQMTYTFDLQSPFRNSLHASIDDGKGAQLLSGKLSAVLREGTALASAHASKAATRTRLLTYGLGCDGLVKCVDEIFEYLFSDVKVAFDEYSNAALSEAQHRAKERMASGQDRDSELYGQDRRTAAGQGDEWKTFEDAMAFLAALREACEKLERVERTITAELFDLSTFLFGTLSAAAEAMTRLCKEETRVCTASFRLLLEASADRMRAGPLNDALKRIRVLGLETSAGANRSSPTLLRGARSALLAQVQSLQRHLGNMMLSPHMPLLEVYAGLPAWEATRLPGAVNEYDLAMPAFSLSPTEEISRIGEALLDLPRLLEVWAERREMQWGVQGLPYATLSRSAHHTDIVRVDDNAVLNSVAGAASFAEGGAAEASSSSQTSKRTSIHGGIGLGAAPMSPQLERRISSSHHRQTPSVADIATIPVGSKSRGQDGDADEARGPAALEGKGMPESALQSYLSSICLTLVAHIVSLALPSIARLSSAGASQLSADLEYLLTILAALNVGEQNESAPPAEGATTAVNTKAEGSTGTELKSATPTTDPNASPTGSDQSTLLLRSLEAWKDVCKLRDADGRRLRHLVRTGQAARGASLAAAATAGAGAGAGAGGAATKGGAIVEGFDGSEDKLRSLLTTEAFDMVARMRGW